MRGQCRIEELQSCIGQFSVESAGGMGFPESPSVSSSLHAAAPRSVTHNNDHNHLFIIRFIVLRFFEGYLVTSVVSALGRVIDSVLTLPKRR